MKQPITSEQISALLALRRDEKPQENFFSDFIVEFHKRLESPPRGSGAAGSSPRPWDERVKECMKWPKPPA